MTVKQSNSSVGLGTQKSIEVSQLRSQPLFRLFERVILESVSSSLP